MAAVSDDMVAVCCSAVRCSGVDRGVEVGHGFECVLRLAVYVHERSGA